MNKFKVILRICGFLLLSTALALTLFNVADAHRAGEAARHVQRSLLDHIESVRRLPQTDDTPIRLPESEPDAVTVDDLSYIGIIELPGAGVSLPVAASWSYTALQDTPCRYSGTAADGDLVICAHNYSSHFGRLSELTPGSEAIFTDCNGKIFRYTLAEEETLAPNDIEAMTDSDYALTLFTCNWNGTARRAYRFVPAPQNAS